MSSDQNDRNRRRLSLFRSKKAGISVSRQTETEQTQSVISNSEYNDRQRVIARYAAATKLLEEAVTGLGGIWGSLKYEELAEPGEYDAQFRDKINRALETRRDKVSDITAWEKCRHAIHCVCTAFSPFAKNFLTIAKGCQLVCILFKLSLTWYRSL